MKTIAIGSSLIFALVALAAIPVFAKNATTTRTLTGDQIACIGSAVSAREASLTAGVLTYTQTVNAAYSARQTALAAAYGQTSQDAVRSSVRTAWNTFKDASKSAQRAWKSTKEKTWKDFRAALKNCRAPSALSDGGNAGLEISGN